MFNTIDLVIKADNYKKVDEVIDLQSEILDKIQKIRKRLIKTLKKEPLSTKSSMLYLELLNETKNLTLYIINLLKAQRDFVLFQKENGN